MADADVVNEVAIEALTRTLVDAQRERDDALAKLSAAESMLADRDAQLVAAAQALAAANAERLTARADKAKLESTLAVDTGGRATDAVLAVMAASGCDFDTAVARMFDAVHRADAAQAKLDATTPR